MQSARHGLTGMFFMVVTFRKGIIIDDVISWHKRIILFYLTSSRDPVGQMIQQFVVGMRRQWDFCSQHVNAGGAHVVPSLVMAGV